MKIIKTNKYIKIAQVNNTLNGKSKMSAKNIIYKLVSPFIKGLFSDQSWEAVNKIWSSLDQAGIEWNMTDNKYQHNDQNIPISKEWKFEVNFINNKQRPDKLYGTLIAHGAGSVQDPLDKYDISFIVG